jgi:hypothetical protein
VPSCTRISDPWHQQGRRGGDHLDGDVFDRLVGANFRIAGGGAGDYQFVGARTERDDDSPESIPIST